MSDATKSAAAGGPSKFLKSALGIIFFIVLIIGGILIAVYGARTIPGLFTNNNGASVYSSSVFHQNTQSTTTPVVNTTTPTAPSNENASSTLGSVFSNGFNTPVLPKIPAIKDSGTTQTTTTTSTGGTTQTTGTRVTTGRYVQVPAQYYGYSDLTVHIIEIGYLNSSDDFIESNEVPSGRVGVVHFAVMNNGTNVSGSWRLEAELPSNQEYLSNYQASIPPGGTSIGELNFDEAEDGNNQDIRVEVDPINQVQESNERNNVATAEIDIR